ncbi:Rossmann-fold NAD(P)-binding domain-containing protein [Actinomadura physcomitrii]|uniref:hypothetical protein n=1 Tax=Actinomadura physcomitrii TaxID=2650748 RepID=UPI001F47F414|nr:hypothetical protein [Actinomadura physcomitrii]
MPVRNQRRGEDAIAAIRRRTPDLPALYAATSPHAEGGGFYGPRGPGHLGGPPAEQKLYRLLRSAEDAERLWRISEDLTRVPIPST